MKKVLVLCLMALCSMGAMYAQFQIDTIYYDKDWKGVEHPAFATYYRITMTPEDHNYPKRYRDFWMDGTQQSEGQFISVDKYDDSKSIFDGESLIYYKSGKLKEKCTRSNNGTYVCSEMYQEDGTPIIKGCQKDGKSEGEFIIYYEDGKPKSISHYKDGELDGETRLYKSDGKLSIKRNFKAGKKDGEEWLYGTTYTSMYTYSQNVLNGAYKRWKDGKLCASATYVNGAFDGAYTFYDEKENPNYIVTYDKGLKISEQGQNTIYYTELKPIAGNTNLRISACMSPRRVGKDLVKVNDVTLNILNPTEDEKKVAIRNVQVKYVATTKEGKDVFSYNQWISSGDAAWLYNAIQSNVDGGVEAIAGNIARAKSTSKSTTSSQSNTSVYHSYFQLNPDAVGYSSGTTTTTYHDKALEYQLLEKESGTANAIKTEWKNEIERINAQLTCEGITLPSGRWEARHLLSYSEIHHKLAGQVKGKIEQIIVSFDIDGASYSITYDCNIPKLTPKIIEDRDDIMDDLRDKNRNSWNYLDYYIEYGAWYNYKTLIETHSKNILDAIKKSK